MILKSIFIIRGRSIKLGYLVSVLQLLQRSKIRFYSVVTNDEKGKQLGISLPKRIHPIFYIDISSFSLNGEKTCILKLNQILTAKQKSREIRTQNQPPKFDRRILIQY